MRISDPVYFFMTEYSHIEAKRVHVVFKDPFGKQRWTHSVVGPAYCKTTLAIYIRRGVYSYRTKKLVTKQWVKANLHGITPKSWETFC
jgi:hypothetical protein